MRSNSLGWFCLYGSIVVYMLTGWWANYLGMQGGFIDGPIKIVWAVPIFLFFLIKPNYFFLRSEIRIFYPIYLILALSFFVGLIGVAIGYYPKYVIGDAIKMTSYWLTFFLSYNLLRSADDSQNRLNQALSFFVLLGVCDAIFVIGLANLATMKISSGGLYLHGYLVLICFWERFKNISGFFSMVALILLVFAGLYSGKRFIILYFLLSAIFVAFYRSYTIKKVALLGYVLVISVLLVPIVSGYFEIDYRNVYGLKNITELYRNLLAGAGDESYGSRISEYLNVLEYYKANPGAILTGAGLGASIKMVFDTSVYAPNGEMHHAHIVWVAYFLRCGFLGVLFLLFFLFFWLGKLRLTSFIFDRRNYPVEYFFGLLVFLYVVTASLKSNMFIGSPALLSALVFYLLLLPGSEKCYSINSSYGLRLYGNP